MICSKDKCTGCFACFNICPKNAIVMEENEYGEIYPTINVDKCINCGLCKKVCPQLKEKHELKEPIAAYAMYNKNSNKRKESSSGGAATTFYEHILKQGGIVYGASNLFGNSEFKFIRIDKIEDLYKVKGSKYVHCYVDDIFVKIKSDLTSGKKVLFIGTPCQVDGLKSFLMKEYVNLITVDIICHGVPSQKLLFDEINRQGISQKNVHYIFFRDEKLFNFKVLDNNKSVIFEESANNVDYYQNFLQGNIYRENCYSCPYASKRRISDVTIGDFWGLDKKSEIYDDESKGISVLLPNTDKGIELVESVSEECNIEKRTIEEACKTNAQLNHPMSKSKKYIIFRKYYPKYRYSKTMKKMNTLKDRVKRLVKNNKMIYKIIKKIK